MCYQETLPWIWLLSTLFSSPSHDVKWSFCTRNKVHVTQPLLVMNIMSFDNMMWSKQTPSCYCYVGTDMWS